MSTNVNLSYDLNNYLKSSGSSINNQTQINKSLIKDWFTGNGNDDKKWYQPLRTSPSDDDLSTNTNINTSNGTGSRWFQNPFKSSQPEPKGWFPSLVIIYN